MLISVLSVSKSSWVLNLQFHSSPVAALSPLPDRLFSTDAALGEELSSQTEVFTSSRRALSVRLVPFWMRDNGIMPFVRAVLQPVSENSTLISRLTEVLSQLLTLQCVHSGNGSFQNPVWHRTHRCPIDTCPAAKTWTIPVCWCFVCPGKVLAAEPVLKAPIPWAALTLGQPKHRANALQCWFYLP